MKTHHSIIAATVIAVASGTGGFFLGKNQSAPATASQGDSKGPGSPNSRKTGQIDSRDGTQLVRIDSPKLIAELNRESDPLIRFNLALKRLEAWVNADPVSALSWLQSQQPSARREEVMRRALAQFAENDAKGAAEWAVANLRGVELNNNLILITEQWARRDGLEASSWLGSLPATSERDAALENALFAWAAENPQAAIQHLDEHADTPKLAAILRYAAFAGWAKTDPRSAVTASLQSSRVHRDAAQFANTLANWATMDLQSSSQWLLENVKSGDERALAVHELAAIFASQSPDSGLAWIAKLNAGPERNAALNSLASEWATSDPAGAAKWASTQPAGQLHPDATARILHNYLASDDAGYESWLASLPEGPLKQQASQVAAPPEDDDEAD